MSLHDEAAWRTAHDGIPRFVTDDGRIMKCDWELASEVDEDFEALEAHIQSLLEELEKEANT